MRRPDRGSRPNIRVWRILTVLVTSLLVVGCGDAGGGADDSITVFAAASLTDAFEALADAFEAGDAGGSVRFSFAGSSSLREQILAGAPADVFASANPQNMEVLVDAGLVESPATFATNLLIIAVEPGNPVGVTGLADFADEELLLGLCAIEVPCGESARQALTNAGVEPVVDTEETDVRSLVTKIAAGDLDAGIVYETDVQANGDVEGIEIAAEHHVSATYPIAVTSSASPADLAAAFVAFVQSDEGQEILRSFGFGPP